MKKRTVLWVSLLFAVLFGTNILVVVLLREHAQLSAYSVPALVIMSVVILNGVLAWIFQDRGNYLHFRRYRPSLLGADHEAQTSSKAYCKEFYQSLLIYGAAIPFYIPLIFLLSEIKQTLWVLLVLFAPQLVFVIRDILRDIKEKEEHKAKQKQMEAELKEQQKREELGNWK